MGNGQELYKKAKTLIPGGKESLQTRKLRDWNTSGPSSELYPVPNIDWRFVSDF